jgi:hypothetical protein
MTEPDDAPAGERTAWAVRIPPESCAWCYDDEAELTHVLDLDRFSFRSFFCSRDCAANWGCAGDADQIERYDGDDAV